MLDWRISERSCWSQRSVVCTVPLTTAMLQSSMLDSAYFQTASHFNSPLVVVDDCNQ
jgi:hypothetical protein